MLVVTTENIAHHRVVGVKGQCFGVVVRSLSGSIKRSPVSCQSGSIGRLVTVFIRAATGERRYITV